MDWTKIKYHLDNEVSFMDKSGGMEFQLRKMYGSPELLLALDRVVDLDKKDRKEAIKSIIIQIRGRG